MNIRFEPEHVFVCLTWRHWLPTRPLRILSKSKMSWADLFEWIYLGKPPANFAWLINFLFSESRYWSKAASWSFSLSIHSLLFNDDEWNWRLFPTTSLQYKRTIHIHKDHLSRNNNRWVLGNDGLLLYGWILAGR